MEELLIIQRFFQICKNGLQILLLIILIDESLLGWKEFELEVVRDRMDNSIIICSIENIDPWESYRG